LLFSDGHETTGLVIADNVICVTFQEIFYEFLFPNLAAILRVIAAKFPQLAYLHEKT
jgi:hypothetical protein